MKRYFLLRVMFFLNVFFGASDFYLATTSGKDVAVNIMLGVFSLFVAYFCLINSENIKKQLENKDADKQSTETK